MFVCAFVCMCVCVIVYVVSLIWDSHNLNNFIFKTYIQQKLFYKIYINVIKNGQKYIDKDFNYNNIFRISANNQLKYSHGYKIWNHQLLYRWGAQIPIVVGPLCSVI